MIKQLMKMNLQFFAEDAGNGGGVDGDQGTDGTQNNTDDGQQSTVTFTSDQQAKVDEIVQARLSKANEKWQQATQSQIKDAIADYQKKSGMTDEQRAAAEQDDNAKKVAELQGKLDQRDRLDHAKQAAAEKQLPAIFADWAVAASDDDTDKRLDAIGKEFNKSVQAAVEERLKGKQTPGAGGGSNTTKAGAFGEKLAKQFAEQAPKSSYFDKK
ncbi:DUF4355 domain-containing protein [Loigolactobacillus coryniformis]|uniref:DUF4355 domain-containing protein n=1 Tax=Loigolactobacillus coryniformis TaxID=1610 RepID=UPI0003126813|nr:DUF4355 domain-containing protein [Loigolactobacillus coryniformis]